MRIRDVVGTGSVLTAREEDNLALANQVMSWAGIRHLPVLRDGRVIGVLSTSDLLHQATQVGWREAARHPVTQAMSQPAETIALEADVDEAAARMVERRIGCLPVVSGGVLVGIVTRTDLLVHQAWEGLAPAPGGDAGVRSVMRADPLTVHEDDDLIEAAARMHRGGIRHLPVIDGARRVVGMLSDQDIRSALGPTALPDGEPWDIRLRSTKVAHAMSAPAVTVPDTASLAFTARYFMDHRVGAVPVVDLDDRLVGIVSYLDLLSAAYKPMG